MRKLLYLPLLAILLTSCVVSCSRSVDKWLVLADTLMWTNPDSSLAILEGINRDSLTSDENLAYHALLITQAQFRCNGRCHGDTLIDLALNHYSDNHNRERYTRSLLYKGAYYEFNTNQPVEAMKCYKQAEENADTTDYRNLAQLYMRMGMLYYNNYASNNLDLEKFKNAHKYYEKVQDKRMIMITLENIGCLYRETDKSKAVRSLSTAKDLAIELCDTLSYYTILNNLSMAFFMDSSFVEAKETAVECISNSEITNAMLFNAANAYAALGMPDSAIYYLNKVNRKDISDYDRMMTAFSRGYIFKASGQEKEALFYQNLGTAISDTIKVKSSRNAIFETENQIGSELRSKKDNHISKQKFIFRLFLVLFFVALIITIVSIIHKNKEFKKLVNDLSNNQFYVKELVNEAKLAYEQLNHERQRSKILQHQYNEQENNLEFLNQYFNSFNTLLNKCYSIKRADFIKELESIITQARTNDSYWDIIIDVANKKSAGFISELKNDNDLLNPIEIRILSLVCLGYSNDAISASTGYTKNSIKTIKSRIRTKIKASENLDAFTKQEIIERNKKT